MLASSNLRRCGTVTRNSVQGPLKTKITDAKDFQYMICLKYTANVTFVVFMSFAIKAELCNYNRLLFLRIQIFTILHFGLKKRRS